MSYLNGFRLYSRHGVWRRVERPGRGVQGRQQVAGLYLHHWQQFQHTQTLVFHLGDTIEMSVHENIKGYVDAKIGYSSMVNVVV